MVSKLSREEKTKAKTGLAQDVDSLVDQLVDMDINQEGTSTKMQNKDSLTKSVLPPELLEEIYKRLVPNDRIRFSSVCKAWLSAVISVKPRCRPPVPEPWLMICHRNHGTFLQNSGESNVQCSNQNNTAGAALLV
ncbi:hypothetical protein ACLB2K_019312 [Fragaria x ananassa]